jgi:hypothetical protein
MVVAWLPRIGGVQGLFIAGACRRGCLHFKLWRELAVEPEQGCAANFTPCMSRRVHQCRQSGKNKE